MNGALNQLSLTVQKGPAADLIPVLFGEKQPIRSKSVMQFAPFNKNLDNSQVIVFLIIVIYVFFFLY